MLKYTLKRILYMIPVLIGISVLVFFILQLAPGDVTHLILGEDQSVEAVEQLREELDAVYNDEQYPESVFTAENWQKVQDAYNTAVAAIDAAKTSGEAGDAQQKAIQTSKKLQSSADYN